MKCEVLLGVIAVAVGCGGGGATCTNMVACGSGSYSACSNRSHCWLSASDGSRFDCNSCSDCSEAATRAATWCGTPSNGSDGGTAMQAQAQACVDWLSCAAAYTPSTYSTLLMTYGPSGTCWQSTASIADGCATACATSLMQAQADSNAPPQCRANAAPPDMAGVQPFDDPGAVFCFSSQPCSTSSPTPVCCDGPTAGGGFGDTCVASVSTCTGSSASATAYECGQASDCATGTVCCGDIGVSNTGRSYFTGTRCQPSCAPSQTQLCVSPSECKAAGARCIGQSISGRNVGLCD